MARKQTSARISTRAAMLLARTAGALRSDWVYFINGEFKVHLCSIADFRSLCATAISQDETKGQKKTTKRKAKRK